MIDPRLSSPSALRNRGPILEVLRRLLPEQGLVLEIASGTGEHVVHFAEALPGLTFQPSDPDPERRASIDAWTRGHANIRGALQLDAITDWPALQAVAVICINMIHIAPWSAAEGLMRNAAGALDPGGMLILYGPFRREGHALEPGNIAFDRDLRARDPRWGLRDLGAVGRLATDHGFSDHGVTEMPANNLCVSYRRTE